MNHAAIWRTASATPGLLKMYVMSNILLHKNKCYMEDIRASFINCMVANSSNSIDSSDRSYSCDSINISDRSNSCDSIDNKDLSVAKVQDNQLIVILLTISPLCK